MAWHTANKGGENMPKEFSIRRVGNHYEVFVDCRFYCSCDTYGEAQDEIDALKEEKV